MMKKKPKTSLNAFDFTVPSCYGCGAPLQINERDSPGYVEPETFNLKKKHRQLKTVKCGICMLLSHGQLITAVGGNGGYAGGKQFITAEELRAKLSHSCQEKALVVKLVDVVDFTESFLSRVRDIILVVTKVDLLPKVTDLNCIGDWVVEATMKKLNFPILIAIRVVMQFVVNHCQCNICTFNKFKVVGGHHWSSVRNSERKKGKRCLYSELISYKDPVAAAARRYKPILSAVPGTNLGPIQIDAFLGDGKLYDTPGVHLHHRQADVVHSEDLNALAPQSLRGISFPNPILNLHKSMMDDIRSSGLIGFSIFWGGLVRIDVMKVLPETRLTFYGPKSVQLHLVPTVEAEEYYQKELGILLTSPTGKQNADRWTGLEAIRELQLRYQDLERPACDICISGLGWISVEPFSQSLKSSYSNELKDNGVIVLNVHVPKPIEIFVRPPLPVGEAGRNWYQYRELTAMDEETRPKWYF